MFHLHTQHCAQHLEGGLDPLAVPRNAHPHLYDVAVGQRTKNPWRRQVLTTDWAPLPFCSGSSILTSILSPTLNSNSFSRLAFCHIERTQQNPTQHGQFGAMWCQEAAGQSPGFSPARSPLNPEQSISSPAIHTHREQSIDEGCLARNDLRRLRPSRRGRGRSRCTQRPTCLLAHHVGHGRCGPRRCSSQSGQHRTQAVALPACGSAELDLAVKVG